MLGFLPLFIVHWADRQPEKHRSPSHTWHILSMLKALFLVEWANWFDSMRL